MHADASAQLIETIKASELFSAAPERCRLLDHFYENKHRRVSSDELEHDHYGRLRGTHEYDPYHARDRAKDLRDKLEKYALHAPPEEWLRCELLPAERNAGYQLRFAVTSAASFFWSPHLASGKPIATVCDPLLFFYDHEAGSMLRYVDVNIDKSDKTKALAELERLHHGANRGNRLAPGHFYLNAGAIAAAESLREFFWKSAKHRVALILTKGGLQEQLRDVSPIMIGTVRTNPVINQMFPTKTTKAVKAAEKTAYRMSSGRFSWVSIEKPRDEEKKVRIPLGMRMQKGGNGLLKTSGNGTLRSLSSGAVVSLGIVTRLPNPLGTGPVTVISSYSILNVAKIGAALSNEARMKSLFKQTDWPLEWEALPKAFQMMFRVTLAPAQMDDEAGDAELLCWRPR